MRDSETLGVRGGWSVMAVEVLPLGHLDLNALRVLPTEETKARGPSLVLVRSPHFRL